MHASRDRLQYVDLLLEKEADVNGRDTRNHTALMNVIWRSWSDGEVINDEDLKLCKMILQVMFNFFFWGGSGFSNVRRARLSTHLIVFDIRKGCITLSISNINVRIKNKDDHVQ